MRQSKFFSYLLAVVFVPALFALFLRMADAATNITSTAAYHWAWNGIVGWMDFYNTLNINVASNATTTGYASSSAGNFVLGSSTYGVYNPGNGNLTGWGWNNTYGWVSFDCNNNDGCGDSPYETLIEPGSGDFHNYAWNDVIGWISFCGNIDGSGGCAQVSSSSYAYKVNTDWRSTSTKGYLDSSTFDTSAAGGAELNSVLWKGPALPGGTCVQFQLAASNASSGPWNSSNFVGYGGDSSSYYPSVGCVSPGVSMPINNYAAHNNYRYFRYRVWLTSDAAQTQSPRIDEIIVNWSP